MTLRPTDRPVKGTWFREHAVRFVAGNLGVLYGILAAMAWAVLMWMFGGKADDEV